MVAKKSNIVTPLFNRPPPTLEEPKLNIVHLAPARLNPTGQPSAALDLSGKAKAIMAVGAGSTGKTTLLRWMCEQGIARNSELGVILATVDPTARSLARYFPAESPGSSDPAKVAEFLEELLTVLMEGGQSAAIDFGGGDTSLARLVRQIPNLVDMLTESHVEPVALYTLSPRVDDLTPLAEMEAAGFQPRATALILNEGRSDPTRDAVDEFAQLRSHSVYKTALARGAVEIWMPRLYAAKAIEDRHISFEHAKRGTMPEGRTDPGLGLFDRSRTHHWLAAMDKAFSPIASWLL